MFVKHKLKSEPRKVVGVWVRSSKVFYYLETGNMSSPSPVDRLVKVLTARDEIPFREDGYQRGEEPYVVMNAATAQARNYEIKPIYLNQLVKKIVEDDDSDAKSTGQGFFK